MAAAERTFISSTYFPNGLSMAAAIATLDILDSHQVLAHILRTGQLLDAGLKTLVDETGLPVTLSPYPQMPFLHFDPSLANDQDARRDRFYASLVSQGVFAHPRHHGFLSWRHGQQEVDHFLEAARKAAHVALHCA